MAASSSPSSSSSDSATECISSQLPSERLEPSRSCSARRMVSRSRRRSASSQRSKFGARRIHKSSSRLPRHRARASRCRRCAAHRSNSVTSAQTSPSRSNSSSLDETTIASQSRALLISEMDCDREWRARPRSPSDQSRSMRRSLDRGCPGRRTNRVSSAICFRVRKPSGVPIALLSDTGPRHRNSGCERRRSRGRLMGSAAAFGRAMGTAGASPKCHRGPPRRKGEFRPTRMQFEDEARREASGGVRRRPPPRSSAWAVAAGVWLAHRSVVPTPRMGGVGEVERPGVGAGFSAAPLGVPRPRRARLGRQDDGAACAAGKPWRSCSLTPKPRGTSSSPSPPPGGKSCVFVSHSCRLRSLRWS
jgi:hypothetical protein